MRCRSRDAKARVCLDSAVRRRSITRLATVLATALTLSIAALAPAQSRPAEGDQAPVESPPRPAAQVEEEPIPAPVADPAEGPAGAEPTAEEIARRLDELEARHEARRYAGAAIDHGRLALRRAEELSERGDRAGAERATQIAWAAFSLASRQLALAQERQALRAAAARLRRAEQRSARAREALELAIERREELRAPEPEQRMRPADEVDDAGEGD